MFVTRSSTADGRHRGSPHLPGSAGARRIAGRAGRVLAALLSAALLAAFGYGWQTYRTFQDHAQTIDVQGLGHAHVTDPALQHVVGDSQNLLIVGVDSRAGLSDQQKRTLHLGVDTSSTSTDTIMLVHVPANGAKATLISIPRDTYVHIPGFSSDKINAAYANGYYNSGATSPAQAQKNGASTLVETVKQLTGVPIDHYIQVGFSGFEDIVKAIGTIPVTLCHSVSDHYSGFHMSAGKHELNPLQALEFVRQRHNIPGPVSDDFGRELRQRYFLAAAFKKILSAHVLLSPTRLHELLAAVDNSFITDGNGFGIEQFAAQMADLSAGNITGASIPNTGYAVINSEDVITVNPSAVQKFVKNAFYGPPPAHHSPAPTHRASTSPSGSSTSSGPTRSATNCVN